MRLATSAATSFERARAAYAALEREIQPDDDEDFQFVRGVLEEGADANAYFLHLGCEPEVVVEVELPRPIDLDELDHEGLRDARRRARDPIPRRLARHVQDVDDLAEAFDEAVEAWIVDRVEAAIASFLGDHVSVSVVPTSAMSWTGADILDLHGPLTMVWWRDCSGPCPAAERADVAASLDFDKVCGLDIDAAQRGAVRALVDDLDDFLHSLSQDRPQFRPLVSR